MMELIISVFAWLKTWPAAVWATIAGSFITLTGVMFSDWRNTRRLKMQHQFAAEESERTRTLQLRKEIYLPVAGTLARLQEFFFGLPMDGVEPEVHPMTELAEVLAKVVLVAETSTAILAQELSSEYTAAYMQLAIIVAPSKEAHSDVARHKEHRENIERQVERVNLEISKFLEAASTNDNVFHAMARRRDFFQKELQRHWAEEIEALGRVESESVTYIQKAIDIVFPIADLGTQFLIAVRKELHQETDQEMLVQAMKKHREKSAQLLQSFVERVEERRKAEKEQADIQAEKQRLITELA